MIGRVCAAQMARQIVRALHLPAVAVEAAAPAKQKPVKTRKKKKAA